jgi:transaldolase/glucose-6-phosphate isomerase
LYGFREGGTVTLSLAEDIESARHVLAETERLGLDLQAVTAELVEDGVRQFADAADKLLAAVEKKQVAFAGGHRT